MPDHTWYIQKNPNHTQQQQPVTNTFIKEHLQLSWTLASALLNEESKDSQEAKYLVNQY